MRAGCKKGKGAAAEVLLEAHETVLKGTETAAATEDDVGVAEDAAAEEVTGDDTLGPFGEPGIAKEEEVGGIVLPDGAFFAASIICNVSTAFGAVPVDLVKRVPEPLCVVTIAKMINTSEAIISRSLFSQKPIFV